MWEVHFIQYTSNILSCCLPCSTTFEENSSLRVNWEQLEPDDEGRGSELEACSEPDRAPPVDSIPTTGRKPDSSPKSMDAHTGNRIMMSWEVAQTISLTRPLKVAVSSRCAVSDEKWAAITWIRVRDWDKAFQVHSSKNESILQTAWAARLISFCVSSPWW